MISVIRMILILDDADHLFTEMCDNGSTHAARIEDLGPGDFVKVDCVACSDMALLK
jgi:hypothetical protein